MLLIGRNQSPFTRRVAVTMSLLDMRFDRREVTAWHNLDEVRQHNPVGRVPSLVLDDGDVVFESGAILDYLDETVGPERALTPPAGRERREVLRMVSCALGVVEKAVHTRYEQMMRPAEKIHQPWIEHNDGQVVSGLDWLEDHIVGPWAHGSRLTQADVTTVVMYDFVASTNRPLIAERSYPKLERLVEQAYELDAFRDTDPSRV